MAMMSCVIIEVMSVVMFFKDEEVQVLASSAQIGGG